MQSSALIILVLPNGFNVSIFFHKLVLIDLSLKFSNRDCIFISEKHSISAFLCLIYLRVHKLRNRSVSKMPNAVEIVFTDTQSRFP